MSKPRLIFRIDDYPNFNQGWVRPLVERHFEMIEWDPNGQYRQDDTVLVYFTNDFDDNSWFRPLEQAGHKIVLDHLFDSDVDTVSYRIHPNKLDLRSPHWLWYRTALLASHFGYDQYQPQPNYSHDFLCLMNKVRDHRDRVMHELATELRTARWSYVDRGIEIGDPNERATPVFWEYYMNPQWYDSTCWHFVVESYVRGDSWFLSPTFPNYKTEISEKSYKPLAYYQPFVVLGSVDTLKFLHSQGFETFDNLWDESYDSITGDHVRVSAVLDHVRDVVKTYNKNWTGWDRFTTEKLHHNHQRFFDLDTVQHRFDQEIISDIMKFISS